MSNNEVLREQIIKEIKDNVAKKNAEIDYLNYVVNNEIFLKSTVKGGVLASAAQNACDKRANSAQQKINVIKDEMAWHKEMLQKYNIADD